MLLRDYAAAYVAMRDVSAEYSKQLLWSIDRIERFIQAAPALSDLSDDLLNRWVAAMLATDLSRRTVRSQRNNILMLWRDAYSEGLVDVGPRRIRKVNCPKLIPDASPPDRLAPLLDEARKLTGRFQRSRVRRREFWLAFIMVEWETGLRLGDLLSLRREWINDAGVLTISQHKTGWPLIRPLSEECRAAINDVFPPERETIFGDALSRGHVQKQFRRLLAAIGLKGGTKRMRRSGATAAEAMRPGAAMGYLGHRTHGLAYQFYVDPRLTQQASHRPPPLDPPPRAA